MFVTSKLGAGRRMNEVPIYFRYNLLELEHPLLFTNVTVILTPVEPTWSQEEKEEWMKEQEGQQKKGRRKRKKHN